MFDPREAIEDWARMAIDTGTAELRDGDYFGVPLNRVARLLGAAHGGQTLGSESTSCLSADSLPPGAALRPLVEPMFCNARSMKIGLVWEIGA